MKQVHGSSLVQSTLCRYPCAQGRHRLISIGNPRVTMNVFVFFQILKHHFPINPSRQTDREKTERSSRKELVSCSYSREKRREGYSYHLPFRLGIGAVCEDGDATRLCDDDDASLAAFVVTGSVSSRIVGGVLRGTGREQGQ